MGIIGGIGSANSGTCRVHCVAAIVGFGWALSLVLAGSLTGLLILRHLGSAHITRMRVVLGQGSFTALQADNRGGQVISAGILLLILGFITDFVALILLFAPLRRGLSAFGGGVAPARNDGVVDLTSGQWHQLPDPSLPDRRKDGRDR
jgi:UPF0716 protein FxsA